MARPENLRKFDVCEGRAPSLRLCTTEMLSNRNRFLWQLVPSTWNVTHTPKGVKLERAAETIFPVFFSFLSISL